MPTATGAVVECGIAFRSASCLRLLSECKNGKGSGVHRKFSKPLNQLSAIKIASIAFYFVAGSVLILSHYIVHDSSRGRIDLV